MSAHKTPCACAACATDEAQLRAICLAWDAMEAAQEAIGDESVRAPLVKALEALCAAFVEGSKIRDMRRFPEEAAP